MLSLSNETEHRDGEEESGSTIQTESTRTSVDNTQDEDSGPRKYVDL